MAIFEFLSLINNLDIKIWLEDGQLRFRAPKGAMTEELKQQMKERKAEIIAFLQEAQTATQITSLSLVPVARDKDLPLSFAQQRMWFLSQLDGESTSYNESFQLRIVGKLSVTALEQSINEIIRRHEALRTNFPTVEGVPFQVIRPNLTLSIPVIDVQDFTEIAVQEIINQEVNKSFDLGTEPLIRVTLLQQAQESYLLIITMHHIIIDGWSMGIFFKELEALYPAFIQGKGSPLTELTIQYPDFALWQREWLTKEVQDKQLEYWKQQLADAPPLLELPTDYPRPPEQTFAGATVEFNINADLTSQLVNLSQKSGVTLFMTLLTAFAVVLHRYSGQDDICIGSPFANRNRREIDTLIGFFVNTLVLRTQMEGNPSFSKLLEKVRSVVSDAHAHQDIPFEQVVEALKPERSLGYNPLFQVMFVLENFSLDTIELPGISLTPEIIDRGTAKFDLSLSMWQTQKGLIGSWEYNSDILAADTIARMISHFQTLLAGIVKNPEQRIGELPLLTESEKHQLLIEWNDTEVEYPQDKCIHQLFEQQVEKTPDAVAVVFENQQLTYQQLNNRANQLAHYLQSLGVKPETLVGICVERSPEMVIGLLGILKAGGAYVPLDPEYPQERLSFMLEDSGISVLLTQSFLVDKLPLDTLANPVTVVYLDEEIDKYPSPIVNGQLSTLRLRSVNVVNYNNLAYVIYTSGSTGRPKGVMIEHRAIVNLSLTWAKIFQVQNHSRLLQFGSFSFDLSVGEITTALVTGACLYLGNKVTLLPSQSLVDFLTVNKITHSFLSPSALSVLPKAKLPDLQCLTVGGEACTTELVNQWGTERRFYNCYGPTESTVTATIFHCQPNGKKPDIGKPISNLRTYILDRNNQILPPGIPGELCIAGVGLARGYLNRPETTAEKFIEIDIFGQVERIYKTGDLARWGNDGNIEYLGRIDNQVKIRGFRIELGEVEAVLNQHPDIQTSCVIAREDIPTDKRLVGYIVPKKDVTPERTAIRQFLVNQLPGYMIPSAFVIVEFLPLTPNGKIDHSALPKPELDSTILEKYVAPRTPIEEMLAQTWLQVLKVESVGVNDNFFELGGHSLLATQLVSRIRNIFQVELPLNKLFATPTVGELADIIGQLQQEKLEFSAPPILPRTENAELALSYAQQRLWFLDQFEPDSAFYNMPEALRLEGTLEFAALEQSLQQIIARHEALRTNFITIDGTPTQIIQNQTNWKISVVDLKNLPLTEQEIAAQKLLQQQATQAFDLAKESLVRATLIVLSQTEHILLLCMHHIVSDGWSMGVFISELAALYNAYSQGKEPALAPLPIQYADFALWQREWLQGDVLQTQLNYWQQKLADAPALLSLPTDRPRPALQTYKGTHQEFALSAELTHKLKKLSQEQGVTLFMTLLAAFDTLLYRYTGQEDILVGSPIANRDRSELERLIGFFVNTLVMRTDLAGNPSFSELLTRVREMAMEAYCHQNLPFEMLVEVLQPERDISHNPLFQVMFVLQNAPTSGLDLTGLNVSSFLIKGITSRFDLTLIMQHTSTGLIGVWEYNTDLFDASTIESMTNHFVNLLQGITANPEQCISKLPLLSEAEQEQLLLEWNDNFVDYPLHKCIHQLFEEQVEHTPHAVAVEFGNQQLTYYELNSRANQLAHYLQSLGVKPDVLVGICVERSLEMVVGILGILKAGGAYVPLDPEYPTERLAFMLEDAQVSVLLTQQSLLSQLPQWEKAGEQGAGSRGETPIIRDRASIKGEDEVLSSPAYQPKIVCLDTDAQVISQLNQENPISAVQTHNLAYVIYTSGSTGKPKGVAMNHLPLCNLILWQLENTTVAQDAKTLQFAPISFDVSFQEIFSTWCSGGTLVLITEELRRDALALLGFLEAKAVARLFVPFVALQQLAEVAVDSELFATHLQEIITAGEQLQITPAISQWFSKLGNCILHNHYGPSESHVVTAFTLSHPVETWPLLPPIGKAIANTEIYLLDQNLQPVPVGIPGELYIGGITLARGYLNRPDLTNEKFIPNPFNHPKSKIQNPKLYKTGDLARYLEDGNIEYLGRIDTQVKIRGFRIELGEVEAALSQYEDVEGCCVIAREDTPAHTCSELSRSKRLVAYVVAHQNCTPTVSALRQFLKAKLPDYMIPSAFVFLESFPLTPSGKVDRRALPAPDLESTLLEKYVAPRTPREELLTQIWAQVLKVEQVGIDDNFFELGGHSLLATQLVSRIRNIFQVELPLRELFAKATVAELSQLIGQLQQQNLELSEPPILPRTQKTQTPLSYAQQRLWFLDQLEPNSAVYNIALALLLTGNLNQTALAQSLQEIINRHEALRTNFRTVDGEATQIIRELLIGNTEQKILSIVDLQHLPTTEQERATEQLAQQEAIKPFNLATESLIRATLVVLSQTEQVLLVCMHHIVSDGWSMGVFTQELAQLYHAYSQGQPSPLAQLSIQYADFALWQRNWLQGDVLQSQLSYWEHQLKDAPALLALPTDRPRPAVQTFAGAHQYFTLSVELTDKLLKLSQEQGCTLFMTLLAAYDTLLYRYTGQSDILVGSPIANRDRAEIEGLIGFFINTLVMRSNLAGNPSFSELMTRVRETAMGAYSHQHLPFEMLVEALQPERDLSYTPLFQVMFALQNAPVAQLELTGLTISSIPIKGVTSAFDLTLAMQNTPNGLMGGWEYNTDLFDHSTIERMTGHFVTLLEAVVNNPQERIDQLPILTAVERQKLLVEWNDTQADYPVSKCLHQLFAQQVELTPDAVSVVFDDQQLTYQQLNTQANQLAHYLQSLGVGAEVLVGIYLERSLSMTVALLAVLKAGGGYVPLDVDYPQQRLTYISQDSQISVLITQESLLNSLPVEGVKVIVLDQEWEVFNSHSPENPVSEVVAENLACVLYTSGSTGNPKGVMLTHGALVNHSSAISEVFGLTSSDRVLQFAAFGFDVALEEMFPTWFKGGTVVLRPTQMFSSFANFAQFIEQQQLSVLTLTSAYWHEWMVALSQSYSTVPQSLRLLTVGGDTLLPETVAMWQKFVGDRITCLNAYGPTEASVTAIVYDVQNYQPEKTNTVLIGRPVDNTEIYILDSNLQPVPIGVKGELYIGGERLARGYLNRPELTQEKFIAHPFNHPKSQIQNPKLYKTGDLARYLPDGNIEFIGRIDDVVKIRGFRVALGEIESLLVQHPDVICQVVMLREDQPGHKQLVAYVVSDNPSLTQNELQSFLKQKLPNYMIPTAFVMMEALPVTTNGKVDRRALPAPSQEIDLNNFVLPTTSIQKLIADIWSSVLGTTQLGIHNNFFDMGGNSLRAMQVMSLLRETLQIDLPLRYLFENPTVAELAAGLVETLYTTSLATNQTDTITTSNLDLKAEAVLDPSIQIRKDFIYNVSTEYNNKPQGIFLTGVTGFLGSHLLYELLQKTQADIYCLIRATDIEQARQKLENQLQSYKLWSGVDRKRIIPVVGDLGKKYLGLSTSEFQKLASQIDVIYHCGAWINVIYPYSVLKPANVLGTQEIIRLACEIKVKPLHYISTTSVLSAATPNEAGLILESDLLDQYQVLENGYVQSKWVAEKLVMQARDLGLPVAIYRASRITGSTQTGISNTDDLFCRLVKGCLETRIFPDVQMEDNLTPVDYVSKMIVHLSKQTESLGQAFHLVNPESTSIRNLFNLILSLGYPVQMIPVERWHSEIFLNSQVCDTDNLRVVSHVIPKTALENGSEPLTDYQNMVNGLRNAGIMYPVLDQDLLRTYISYFISSGFIDERLLQKQVIFGNT